MVFIDKINTSMTDWEVLFTMAKMIATSGKC